MSEVKTLIELIKKDIESINKGLEKDLSLVYLNILNLVQRCLKKAMDMIFEGENH